MTNLTEQWKKGELPDGWYYVKGNRAEGKYAYTAEYLNNMYRPRNGEIIIEQVPSFEQWQAKLEENTKLKTENKWYSEQLHGWVDRAGDLEELLKECREVIKNVDTYYGNYDSTNGYLVITKIAQVLGEE